MLGKSEIRRLIRGTWRDAGCSGRGGRWAYAGSEIQWLLTLGGDWLGRIHMTADAQLRAAADDDYPLRVFGDALPNVDFHRLALALGADTNVSDEERGHIVRESAQALADFVAAHGTLDALRESYRSGNLDSMSIRKDLRALLEER